jgi:hypothetical protein
MVISLLWIVIFLAFLHKAYGHGSAYILTTLEESCCIMNLRLNVDHAMILVISSLSLLLYHCLKLLECTYRNCLMRTKVIARDFVIRVRLARHRTFREQHIYLDLVAYAPNPTPAPL